MGIPGILKEIGKGERIALSKLAVEHLERTRQPLRIAIDAAIWNFQNQAGQGGANPALRTLFYRLLKILALPIHPVFVYDGKNKPLTKRNKTVSAYGTCITNESSKKLVQEFRFPHYTAPGEAEAECALLQKHGIVDAVMSQDVDAIMFGSTMTLRNWSKEATRGNNNATHVDVLRLVDIKAKTHLTPEGLILIALLSGGDYNTDGIPGFGPSLACEIARAGFGADLLELVTDDNASGIREWREQLQYELETNESGYFKKKHKTLRIPEDFPNRTILSYYTHPAVSSKADLSSLQEKWEQTWDQEIDVPGLRKYVADKFEWLYKSGARKFTRCLAPSLLAHRLRRGFSNTTIVSSNAIKERRQHFVNDGIPELRVEVIPGEVVGLDIEAEEDNPAWLADEAIVEDEETPAEMDQEVSAEFDERTSVPASPSKKQTPPWDPSVPEKIWIPETIVQLGVPALVEEWQQKQRDILADPYKFVNRKLRKSKTDPRPKGTGMGPGTLTGYFPTTKPDARSMSLKTANTASSRPRLPRNDNISTATVTPKSMNHPTRNQTSGDKTPTLDRYFGKLPATMSITESQDREFILISSSPPLRDDIRTETLLPDEPNGDNRRLAHRELEISRTVTQRRRSRNRNMISAKPPKQVQPQAAEPALIQAFFKPPALSESKSSSATLLPPALSVGLKSSFLTKKVALSRDSLPGTWKEVDPALLETASPKSRGRPRVSCVDLTEG